MIFQPKQRVELALLPFFNPLGDVVLENEVKERPLLDVESGIDEYPRRPSGTHHWPAVGDRPAVGDIPLAGRN